MNAKAILISLITLNTCLISNISMAETPTFQSHESILSATRQYLESHNDLQKYNKINIQLGKIDPRLKLSKCDQPLQLSLAPGSNTKGKTTINVHCPAAKAWKIYITAIINRFATVYQTADNLAKGHIITDQDIQPVEYNLAKLNRGYFTDKTDLIGKETKRPLYQHKIIHPSQVKAPYLVKQGEQVSLIAGNRQFSVQMTGKALANGALGDHIRVKNLSSKRIIEGKVTRNGEVTVFN